VLKWVYYGRLIRAQQIMGGASGILAGEVLAFVEIVAKYLERKGRRWIGLGD
jgi:hypothetical protein